MAKKKKKPNYDYDVMSALHGIISEDSHAFINMANVHTLDNLAPLWIKNMKENHKNRMWKKHGSFIRSCTGLGVDKAIIGVGAGPSFNKNAHVLKFIHDNDAVKNWEDRDFIIFASNHQFKPMLKMGIIPDFVYLVDASDMPSVYKQLCVDIPKSGDGAILITPFHVAPRIVKDWSKQGRRILFFLANGQKLQDAFQKIVGKSPTNHSMICGGNILNTM